VCSMNCELACGGISQLQSRDIFNYFILLLFTKVVNNV
jgi:hypothetical protein